MENRLRIETTAFYNKNAFFKIIELPFSALVEYLQNSFSGVSLDVQIPEKNESFVETVVDYEKSLPEEIMENIIFANLDDETEKVAEYIAYNLDNKGKMIVSVQEICEKFGVSEQIVKRAIDAIRESGPEGILDGKVAGYGDASIYVEPDIIITEDLNVSVRSFEMKVPRNATKTQLKIISFLNEALNRRKELLLFLGKTLLKENALFILGKSTYPKKTKMTDIANTMNISISTVSKAISGKYVKTPSRIFELKTFFGRHVAGDYLTAEIAKIILEKGKSITDREITIILNSQGIEVSRRTVNNYRRRAAEILERNGKF
ncbi:HTH domain-containing protein [Pseudothermotoga sp.]|uniref:RNA polymerase factor sigma-54 n=1 Tax=Pseudothermotoga sp. TaxID=2033661 RepID=UPI002588A57C|nr:HTH domain-containing protein [Pseudothermotoga sp.]MDK2885339.1 polymerase sigma-54 factor [Pseudothermotoga sp.]